MPRTLRDARAKAETLFAAGKDNKEVERELDLPESTARVWYKRWQEGGGGMADGPNVAMRQSPIQPVEIDRMKMAALEAKVKLLERQPVISLYQPEVALTDHSAIWKRAEVDNAERIRKALTMALFEVTLPAEPCALCFVGDQHISLGNCVDLERMREDAELISSTPGCYAILGGDGVDNHIKHRAAVLAARSQPHDQYELFEWYLSIFAHRILVVLSGNHDAWTNQIAGVDVVSMICQRQQLCYAPDEAILGVQVGGEKYKIGTRHQYRLNSSFNETHAVKQWFRNGECDWDIGNINHNHTSAVEPFWAHGKERWACRTGSYQITSAYSRQYGYNKTRPMAPSFVVYPDRREIIGFHDLRPAMRFLKAERGGK